MFHYIQLCILLVVFWIRIQFNALFTFKVVEPGGIEILLVAPRYRSKPDVDTVLMGRLTRLQTLLCKIVINLKIPILQWRQSSCLVSNDYINMKDNYLSFITHQHWQNFQLYFDSFIFCLSSVLQKFVCVWHYLTNI